MLIDHHIHFTNEEDIFKLIKHYKIKKAIVFAKRIDENLTNPYKGENQKVLDFAKKNKELVRLGENNTFLKSIE